MASLAVAALGVYGAVMGVQVGGTFGAVLCAVNVVFAVLNAINGIEELSR